MKTYEVRISYTLELNDRSSMSVFPAVQASNAKTAMTRGVDAFMKHRKDRGMKGEPDTVNVSVRLKAGPAATKKAADKAQAEHQAAKEAECARRGHLMLGNGRGSHTCMDCSYKRAGDSASCSQCGDHAQRLHVVNDTYFCRNCSPIQGHANA